MQTMETYVNKCYQMQYCKLHSFKIVILVSCNVLHLIRNLAFQKSKLWIYYFFINKCILREILSFTPNWDGNLSTFRKIIKFSIFEFFSGGRPQRPLKFRILEFLKKKFNTFFFKNNFWMEVFYLIKSLSQPEGALFM